MVGFLFLLLGAERASAFEWQTSTPESQGLSRAKLLALKDPATGEPVATKIYKSREYYQDRGGLEVGPDMQIGYAKGLQASDETAGGAAVGVVFSDNDMEWSGNHCMDHEAVPGVLFTNRTLKRPAGALKDLAGAILAEYGIEGFPRRSPTD